MRKTLTRVALAATLALSTAGVAYADDSRDRSEVKEQFRSGRCEVEWKIEQEEDKVKWEFEAKNCQGADLSRAGLPGNAADLLARDGDFEIKRESEDERGCRVKFEYKVDGEKAELKYEAEGSTCPPFDGTFPTPEKLRGF